MKPPKIILRKILVGLALFCVGTFVSYLISCFANESYSYWVRHPFSPIFLMTVVFIAAYKPADLLIKALLEKYFFQKKTFAQVSLSDLVKDLVVNLDLQEVANLVVNTFGDVFRLKTVALLTSDSIQNQYEIVAQYGWQLSRSKKIRISSDSLLVKSIYQAGQHILVRDTLLRSLTWQKANELSKDLDGLQAGWIAPLFIKDNLIGFLAFGAKTPETIFDQTDFHIFRKFAEQIAPCVQNAMVVRRLREINNELQDSQSQWIQKTKQNAIEKLAAGIAHEIHNPLAIISGKAQVILMQRGAKSLDPKVQDALNTIVKQTRRAADITKKLLIYSQETKSSCEYVSLEKVLDETLALLAYQASLDGIEVVRNLDPELPQYYANKQEIRELFFNLLLNAVEAVSGGGKITVELRYRKNENLIEIYCSDTGRGIGEESIDKIFNPFYTTRHEAVGLGLFVTKQIINRYGGSVRVESQLGIGTMFIIQLPESNQSANSSDEEVFKAQTI